jgi:CRP-like cAMP-binding protein
MSSRIQAPTPKGRIGSNQLLASLPDHEQRRLIARSTRLLVEPERPLQLARRRIDRVFFPTTAVVSLLTTLRDGSTVETATIGREGMVGVGAFLGDDRSPNTAAVAQMGGEVLAMDLEVFRTELADSAKMQQSLTEYTRALLVQISQGVACGVVHGVDQRLARWLLQTSDRVLSDEVRLTHQFLAEILHVRRASVSEGARRLQTAGAIDVRRGSILVVDRERLEAASCECYRFIRDEYRRLSLS